MLTCPSARPVRRFSYLLYASLSVVLPSQNPFAIVWLQQATFSQILGAADSAYQFLAIDVLAEHAGREASLWDQPVELTRARTSVCPFNINLALHSCAGIPHSVASGRLRSVLHKNTHNMMFCKVLLLSSALSR